MDNKKYFETLKVCMGVEVGRIKGIEILENSEADLNYYLNNVRKCFESLDDKGGKEDIITIFEHLAKMFKYKYSDVSEKELVKVYIDFLKSYSSILNKHRMSTLIGFYKNKMHNLIDTFNLIKVAKVAGNNIHLKGKDFKVESVCYTGGVFGFKINDNFTQCGALFIKGDDIETVNIKDSDEQNNLLKRLISEDLSKYDIVLIPEYKIRGYMIHDKFLCDELTNKELFNFIYIVDNIGNLFKPEDNKGLRVIKNSDIHISKWYNIIKQGIESKSIVLSERQIMRLLALIVYELKPLNDNDRSLYIKEITSILKYKFNKISYSFNTDINLLGDIEYDDLTYNGRRYGIKYLIKELKKQRLVDVDKFECIVYGTNEIVNIYSDNGYVIETESEEYDKGVAIIDYDYSLTVYDKGSTDLKEIYRGDNYLISIDIN